ncbi:mitochondrial ribonuclease P catalytic subunit-like isoform X2 [Thrips palmi]|nr:mitochondrial ribonuclease P catalytic subunit-like isoform X2 [Thrips palmi]XP_034238780.1 mitochondrial ribonuclease P catalytic subunit-like isoform X2 [Thrips palmi]
MRLFRRLCNINKAVIAQFLPSAFEVAQNVNRSDCKVYLTVRNILNMKKQLSVSDWRKLSKVCSERGFGYQAFVALVSKDPGLSELKILFAALHQENFLSLILKAQTLQVFKMYEADCTADDHKFILDTVDEVTNKFQVLTPHIVKPLLFGVGVTSSWKEKCELLGSMLSTHDACVPELSALAAFRHGDFDYAWDQLRKAAAFLGGTNCCPELFHGIVESHILYPNEGLLSKLFDFIQEFSLSLPVSVAEEIDSILNKDVKTVSRFSTVGLSGHCSCCKRKLKKIPLTSEEKDSLLKSVEKRFEVNCKFTTYEAGELHEFKMFLKMSPPFTVVIDGANLFFRTKSSSNPFAIAKKTVKDLEDRGHKILLLGRNHMRGKTGFTSVFKNHITYFVRDRSVDDAYIIYAAVSGGPNTLLVSNDFYGTYYARMPQESRAAFRKWQLSHQVVGTGYLAANLVLPEFSPICQKSEDGSALHIPIVPNSSRNSFSPSGWLCIQRNVTKEQKSKSSTLWPVRKFDVEDVDRHFAFRNHAIQVREKIESSKNNTKSVKNLINVN